MIFHLARCLGPACAGMLLLAGTVAPVFLVNAAVTGLFVLTLFTLPLPRVAAVARRPQRELVREIGQGLLYATGQPTIATLLLLTTVVCLLIRPYVELLPGLTGLLFDGRPDTLAHLTTANGAGALLGGLVMLAFGLGTLPNLLLISKFSAALTQFGHYPWVRFLAASLLLITGAYGLYRAWVLPEALLKGGFCIA